MYRHLLLFSMLLLLGSVATSCSSGSDKPENTIVYYSIYHTSDTDSVFRKVMLHEIKNQELKRQIARFDSSYRYDPSATEGIGISCEIYNDSIIYWVGYAINIGNISGLILCEPVAGKPVYLNMWDLYKDIQLPQEKAVEGLKDANSKEYKYQIKILQKGPQIANGEVYREFLEVTSDFVSWRLVFDRDQHLLRIDTMGTVIPGR